MERRSCVCFNSFTKVNVHKAKLQISLNLSINNKPNSDRMLHFEGSCLILASKRNICAIVTGPEAQIVTINTFSPRIMIIPQRMLLTLFFHVASN